MIKTRKENLLYEFKISLNSICKRQDRITFFSFNPSDGIVNNPLIYKNIATINNKKLFELSRSQLHVTCEQGKKQRNFLVILRIPPTPGGQRAVY